MADMRIGIMGAMREEIQALLSVLEHTSVSVVAGISFYAGTLDGIAVVICQSGVGKVNAAMCTQLLIDRYQITRLIFTGVAGALHPELEIGDLVISDDAMYHDMDATALGFDQGEIPFAGKSIFVADAMLVQLAMGTSERLYPRRVYRGRVLSGDQFIANRQTVNDLRNGLGGWCTEMEGAAVAHVCDANEVPFVIIRSISDRADGSANVNFSEFVHVVADHSAAIVVGMCNEMRIKYGSLIR
jgi:adenosylhomocysteine nucleosidase